MLAFKKQWIQKKNLACLFTDLVLLGKYVKIIFMKWALDIFRFFATCTNSSKIPFTPKVGGFCENNFLKLVIGSQRIIEGRSLICGERG